MKSKSWTENPLGNKAKWIMNRKIKITLACFILSLLFFMANEYFIGPAKIPGGLPLSFEEISGRFWEYFILAAITTFICYLALTSDSK